MLTTEEREQFIEKAMAIFVLTDDLVEAQFTYLSLESEWKKKVNELSGHEIVKQLGGIDEAHELIVEAHDRSGLTAKYPGSAAALDQVRDQLLRESQAREQAATS